MKQKNNITSTSFVKDKNKILKGRACLIPIAFRKQRFQNVSRKTISSGALIIKATRQQTFSEPNWHTNKPSGRMYMEVVTMFAMKKQAMHSISTYWQAEVNLLLHANDLNSDAIWMHSQHHDIFSFCTNIKPDREAPIPKNEWDLKARGQIY